MTALLTAGAALAPSSVGAAWSLPPSGGAAVGEAAALVVQSRPTASGSGLDLARTFTVTWPAAPTGPVPVTGYVVHRSSSLLGAGLISSGTCTGTTVLGVAAVVQPPAVAGTRSCTDVALVQLGVVRYSVTPVYERWVGPPSAWSAPTS